MKIVLLFTLLLFSGCSLQTPPNNFEYKSANSFSSYTKNFLSANDLLAKNDMKRAIKHAKQSANLNTLARIYLGECSLNISVGIKDNCSKYEDIRDIAKDKYLESYYSLIRKKLQYNDIESLPKRYKKFAFYFINNKYNKAYKEISSMQEINSQLISAYLIKEYLDEKQILSIIDKASFYGYKKSVLFWLKTLKNITVDEHKKERISKKIDILKSSE